MSICRSLMQTYLFFFSVGEGEYNNWVEGFYKAGYSRHSLSQPYFDNDIVIPRKSMLKLRQEKSRLWCFPMFPFPPEIRRVDGSLLKILILKSLDFPEGILDSNLPGESRLANWQSTSKAKLTRYVVILRILKPYEFSFSADKPKRSCVHAELIVYILFYSVIITVYMDCWVRSLFRDFIRM